MDHVQVKKTDFQNEIGVVVIGRNEGKRLKRCLQSVLDQVKCIVYVDSGSSDNSVEYAKSIKVDVVQLDMRTPFSAGRARNEGAQHLLAEHKQLQYIQFIDGDCEMCEGWILFALTFLEDNSNCAIAAGRTFEKFPKTSVYNLLCDIEWNTTPIGEAKSCGGIFMVRKEPFLQVKGFNPTVIAGEEPEMCYRLRKKNWLIFRLDHPMAMHDAAITRFSQWWKRSVRTGHAYSQVHTLHKQDGQRYRLKVLLKNWFWAFIFPITVLILALTINTSFFFLYLAYLLQIVKTAIYVHKRLKNLKYSIIYGIFTVIAKWPQFWGQLIFLKRKFTDNEYSIIEYN